MTALRTSRTRLAAAAATTVLAALSLTACGNGTGAHDEGAATTTSPSTATGTASPGADSGSTGSTGTTTSQGTTGSTGASGSTGAGSTTGGSKQTARTSAPKAPASSGKTVTCEGSNTKTVAAPLNRPVNHMLLTVTNTGSKTCFLYGYPSVQFTDAQSEPPVIDESQPQAVVTLEPGQSGYAAVSLSATDGSGGKGRTAKSLTVYFYGRSLSGNVGAPARPALPAKGVHIDDSIKVTYWQQSMDDAVTW